MKTYYNNQSKASGVYLIINTVSKKYYIGSAKRFYTRSSQHLRALKNNKHHNQYLQNSFNKYGENSFEFHVLEVCDNRIESEQYYLNECFNDPNCFNIDSIATNTNRIRITNNCPTKEQLRKSYSRVKSVEERQKISLSRLGKTGFHNKDKMFSLQTQIVLESIRNENVVSIQIEDKDLMKTELRKCYNRWGKTTEKQKREKKLLKQFMVENGLYIDNRKDSWLRKSEQHKKEAIEILLKAQERSPARIKGKNKKPQNASEAV